MPRNREEYAAKLSVWLSEVNSQRSRQEIIQSALSDKGGSLNVQILEVLLDIRDCLWNSAKFNFLINDDLKGCLSDLAADGSDRAARADNK